MSHGLELPPEACPNGGVCITLGPRVDQHDIALASVAKDIGTLKADVHEIKITLRERDNLMGFLKTVFLSLLSIFFVGLMGICGQVVMTARWMAQTDMQFANLLEAEADLKQIVSDHEERIRFEEKKP
jgi:hypothetical protein